MTLPNPLLSFDALPDFPSVQAAHVVPAIEQLLRDAQAAREQVCSASHFGHVAPTWQGVAGVLDLALERLSRAWNVVGHLNAVADTPELRAAYNQALPDVTAFWTALGADERLYGVYKAMDPISLNAEQRRAREQALRNFVLGGAELTGPDKARYSTIQDRMAELGAKFSENALDATDGWSHLASAEDMVGVPADMLTATRQAAEAVGLVGHKLSLKAPCYLAIMMFASNRALRERMYRAWVTRGSDQAEGDLTQFDNAANMAEQIALRQEEAQLLGFANYAELSLATKMASTPQQVTHFLRDLARRARPFAETDLADARRHACEHLGLTDPQSWDWAYIGEKLKEARYSYSEQEVKQYFTAPKVVDGLFKIVERLFQVQIKSEVAPVWHEAAQVFRVERQGQLIAQFYLDQPARDGKRGGAWMDAARDRWLRPDTQQVQTPVAYLTCNFAAAVDGRPALLTHDDVVTLFHEFGHGLHLMLTQVNERDVGMSGVEWDAIELPSQFMENFCWEWDVLRDMTAHVDTGDQMPKALFDKMLAAKNYQSGLQTLRQVEFGLYDMGMHTDATLGHDLVAHARAVRAEVGVLSPPGYQRDNVFGHLFGSGGGYAAGYYSYKWAELLSADAYAAFEETALPDGSANPETGLHYWQEILAVGSARPAMDSFKAFRGREPTIDALLRHHGMAA